MPPKKQQINPFSMYMREQEPILRRRGMQFNSKKEVVEYLFPHFNALSDFDRQKYKNLAKMEKEAAKQDLTRKFDDRGVPLSQIAAEEDEIRQKKEDMLRHVRSLVHDRSNGIPLLNVKFYNMFISLHCYTDHGKQAEYIPCEVALTEWTIADGVTRSCSYIIEPDSIPTGYRSRCRDISDNSHQVPLGHPGAETSMPGVWIRLKNFINPQEELDEYPPVFTAGPELHEVEGALDWLYLRSADRRADPFRVYPLERLAYELFEAAGEPQVETFCNDLVTQGHFDYFTDLACSFHQQIDNSKFCTLAMARRQAFAVLDRVAGHFNVQLLPGRHVPQSKNDAAVEVYAPMAGAAAARKPIQFKASKEKEPDLPTEYKLIQPVRSAFRGGDWETPIAPGPTSRSESWVPAYPAGQSAAWGSSGGGDSAPSSQQQHPRRPAAIGQAATKSPALSQQEYPALGVDSQQEFPALGARSEQEFPALGAAGGAGLAGRSRPLTTRPRAPGQRPAPELRVPVIGRGRSTSRTTVAGTLAERFANQPGRP